jgi:hypothetical protein
MEPSSKRSRPWSFLWVSSQYVCVVDYMFTPLPLLLFLALNSESGAVVIGSRLVGPGHSSAASGGIGNGAARCWRRIAGYYWH